MRRAALDRLDAMGARVARRIAQGTTAAEFGRLDVLANANLGGAARPAARRTPLTPTDRQETHHGRRYRRTGTASFYATNETTRSDYSTNLNGYDGFDLIWRQNYLQTQMKSIENDIRTIEKNSNLSDTEKMFSMQMAMKQLVGDQQPAHQHAQVGLRHAEVGRQQRR